MRARAPDASGFVERDGVLLHHEVFGDGAPTVMLLPTWSIVHSRVWKMQIPYLARHFRVVTFDGRGCGRSGRPVGPAAYTHEQFAADAIAVLDATGTDTVVLVGHVLRRPLGHPARCRASRPGPRLRVDRFECSTGARPSRASRGPDLGEAQTALTGSRTMPGSSSSSSAGCSPKRTRPSRSRTPSGGGSTSDRPR